MNGLRLKAFAGQVLLLSRIGRVHVSRKQEIESVAASATIADSIGSAFVHQWEIDLHAGLSHACNKIFGDADLHTSRTRNVDEVHQQSSDVVCADVCCC